MNFVETIASPNVVQPSRHDIGAEAVRRMRKVFTEDENNIG
jgi:hypothetical protein